jgi:hypothetical protein
MKFLVFLAVIVAIWYGARWFRNSTAIPRQRQTGQRQPGQRQAGGQRPNPYAPDGRKSVPRAMDTILCARCGTYVPADFPTACGRKDCPFPSSG